MLNHEKQIIECEETINRLKEQNKVNGIWTDEEIIKLEKKLQQLKDKVYSNLSSWERVGICRHPKRPRAIDYIKNIGDGFEEIFGDRCIGDDNSIITGFLKIAGEKFAIVAQEKGCDTDSRLYRNFGMPHPEGYRKALRLMKLAAKFNLPVISLIDTPGAYPGLRAEEKGQGWVIAQNLKEMSILPTQIIAVLIGEGCSGGALAIGISDVMAMLEHSYYSVISPEGCATILWHDKNKNEEASKALKMNSEDLLSYGIIDEIIKEPLGGAHHDTKLVYENVKNYILSQIKILKKFSIEELLENRYQKFRRIGVFAID